MQAILNDLGKWGWMLVHSLWIGLLAAVLAEACLLCLGPGKSLRRHNAVLAFLLVFVAATVGTYFWQPHSRFFSGADIVITRTGEGAFLLARALPSNWSNGLLGIVSGILPALGISWALVVLLKSVRLLLAYRDLNRIVNTAVPAGLTAELEKLVAATNRRANIQVKASPQIDSPFIKGFYHPVILLPLPYFSRFSTAEIKCILAHELAHARRKDYVVHLIQAVFDCVFFFNPFYRRMTDQVRTEREYCCDDAVLQNLKNEKEYATTLISVYEKNFQSGNPVGLPFASQEPAVVNRVKRILLRGYAAVHVARYLSLFLCAIATLSLLLSFANGPKNYTVRAYPASTLLPLRSPGGANNGFMPGATDRRAWRRTNAQDSETVRHLARDTSDRNLLGRVSQLLEKLGRRMNEERIYSVHLSQAELRVNGFVRPELWHRMAMASLCGAGVSSVEYYDPVSKQPAD